MNGPFPPSQPQLQLSRSYEWLLNFHYDDTVIRSLIHACIRSLIQQTPTQDARHTLDMVLKVGNSSQYTLAS